MRTTTAQTEAAEPQEPGTAQQMDLLDTGRVALYLGVSRGRVRQLARRGTLPACKAGRQWRFRADEVRAWIRERYPIQGSFAEYVRRLWEELRQAAEAAGHGPEDIPRVIEEVRAARRERAARRD